MVIVTSYPTRANGITILVNSQKPGFAADFYFGHYRELKLKTSCGKFLNLAHYFRYDIKLRLLAHSRSFLADQKARNAIVGAENLLACVRARIAKRQATQAKNLRNVIIQRIEPLVFVHSYTEGSFSV